MTVSWEVKSFQQLTPFELYQILQLRIEVFMLEQHCLYPECDDKDLPAYHLFATMDGKVVAYARLLPQDVSYPELSIGRVVVHPSHRKYGLGKDLVQRAVQFWEKHAIGSPIRISAQLYLQRFYEDQGFRRITDEYLEDGIPHIGMRRN